MQLGVSKINGSFTEEHNDYIVGLSQGKLDGEGSCGLKAYTLVELTWMVFEAGSELKLVTDGLYLSPLLLFLLILMQA